MKKIPKLLVLALASSLALTLTYGFASARLRHDTSDPNQAPELIGGPWLNTEGGHPMTLESRHGKPTLVAFWTFACENCQHNLPAYARLLKKFRVKGVELISVHTPEMAMERKVDDVAKHVADDAIDYPVLIDNDSANWKLWHVNMWPSMYVVDGNGVIRYHWFGELNWQGAGGEKKIAEVLDALLAER